MKVIRLCIVVSKHEACSFTAAYVTKIVYRKDVLIQILKHLPSISGGWFWWILLLIFSSFSVFNMAVILSPCFFKSISISPQLKNLLAKALHKRTKYFTEKAQHADGLSTVHEAYQFLMKTYPGVQPSMPKTDFSSTKSSTSNKSTRRRISQTSVGTLSNTSSRRSSDTSSVISFNEFVEIIEPEFRRPTSVNIPIHRIPKSR